MLCKICTRCGLCPGDGTFKADKTLEISVQGLDVPLKKDENIPPSFIGIAIDLGTTTVVAKAYRLCNAQFLAEYKEANFQGRFGSDVIARISFATEENGYKKIRELTLLQIEKAVKQLLGEVSFLFSEQRIARPHLEKIVITGNTAMQSFAAGTSVKGLSCYPFECEYLFGEEKSAAAFFGQSFFLSSSCKVYFTPAVSAFAGGDTVAAMAACSFTEEAKNVRILADVGTNCEMALIKNSSVYCTSSAAGPAFEGYGIKCGMNACKGAIAKVSLNKKNESSFLCSVIGGGKAEGICGTGLLSAVSLFYRKGIINQNGTFAKGTNAIELCDGIKLYQNDIRNFQLAKAAVYSGIEALLKKADVTDEADNAALYLAGGFGTKLNQEDAAFTGMIPGVLKKNVIHAGNAALSGACMLLFDDELRKKAQTLSRNVKNINLAQEDSFQESYIRSLNFPEIF